MQQTLLLINTPQPPGPAGRFFIVHPIMLHFAAHQSASRRTVMKSKNPLTVRPTPASELKRAKSLIRLTESILGKSIAPARNRTDEQGRKQGYWVVRLANGDVFEGTYKDGKPHGHWIWRLADGVVSEGPMVDGQRNGHWVIRFASGDVGEGPYVNGRPHGDWVLRWADGGVWEGPYNDKQLDHWVNRNGDGDASESGRRIMRWWFRLNGIPAAIIDC